MKSIICDALIWTTNDVARYMCVSHGTVGRMIKDGRLPPPSGTIPWRTWKRREILDYTAQPDRVSLAKASKIMGVSRPTVYEWIRTGQLPEPRRDRRGQFWYRGEIEPAMMKKLLTRAASGGNKG